MSFRSKKYDRSESLYVRSRWVTPGHTRNSLEFAVPGQKGRKIQFWTGRRPWSENMQPAFKLEMDCRLQRTWTGDYYLCVPQAYGEKEADKPSAMEVENQDLLQNALPKLRVASLDPGVRTFQTIFDASTGCAIEVAPGDMSRVFRLCYAIDVLISKRAKEKDKKRRYHLKRAERRLRERVRNLVDEVHKQLAKYLASEFDLVMLPKFEVSGMVRKADRVLRSKTVRQMMATWAHYRFRQRLLFKARQLGRCRVALVDEAWTSKTCSACGLLNRKLGAAKTYVCHRARGGCGAEMDRDVNGAKNVFLKNYEALGMSVTRVVAPVSGFGAYPL
jgi:putative transposase